MAKLFGAIPRPTRTLEQTYTVEPTQDGERSVTLRRVGDSQGLMLVYHVPAGSHPDDAALDVLAGVLGDVPPAASTRPWWTTRRPWARPWRWNDLHDAGFMMASVRLKTDQSLDEARQILLKTVEGLANEPPTKEEVERVKTRMLKNIELEMNDSQAVALDLSEYASQGDWRLLFLTRDRIKAVTEADVLRVAKAYLKESNRTLASFIPTKIPDRAEIPATPDIAATLKDFKGSAVVVAGEAFDTSPANIESRVVRSTLPDGMKMSLLSRKTRGGTVVASVTIRYGEREVALRQIRHRRNHRRSAHARHQEQIAPADSGRDGSPEGARSTSPAAPTSATASVETIEANLPGALRLAAEILREPAFPDSEFETVQTAAHRRRRGRPQRTAGAGAHRLPPSPRHVSARRPALRADRRRADRRPQEGHARRCAQILSGVLRRAAWAKSPSSGQFDAPADCQAGDRTLRQLEESRQLCARVTSMYQKIAPSNQKIETPDKQNAFFVAGHRSKSTTKTRTMRPW